MKYLVYSPFVFYSFNYLSCISSLFPLECGFDIEYHNISIFSPTSSEAYVVVTGVISGALLYIRDEFEEVNQSSFLQVCNCVS